MSHTHEDHPDPYAGDEPVWSGQPNVALMAEVTAMRPGTVVDVGCGEGADAVWLASRGWKVTGVDVSERGLQRARHAAQAAEVEVRFVHAPLLEAGLEPVDLVSAFYPALLRGEDPTTELELLRLVAPGGTLLFVHHAEIDRERARAHGFDPDDYINRADLLAVLDDGWTIEVDEQRERNVSTGEGAHHKLDLILRARRVA